MDPELEEMTAIAAKAKHDPEGAYEDLKRVIHRDDSHDEPLTNDEFKIMRRFESGSFPEEQTHLTSKQTVDLMSAWFKVKR